MTIVLFVTLLPEGMRTFLQYEAATNFLELIAWRERDTTASVGRFIIEFRRHHLRAGQIWGDAGGMGTPMCDMLADAGWSINRFDFGGKAGNSQIYYNKGCEIWMRLSRMVEKGEIVLINDPTLIGQLTTRRIFYDLKGRVRLESKDDLRARGIKSPDRADAVAGCFALGSPSFAKFVKQTDDPWEQLDQYYDGLPGRLQRRRFARIRYAEKDRWLGWRMKVSRIEEVDLAYVLFWVVLMGGFLTAILVQMVRIERNTR